MVPNTDTKTHWTSADLKYIYEGEYQGRGRPRRYDGKVKKEDLSRLDVETMEKEGKRKSSSIAK